ncbi:MAG: ComEC/Rec2 family competence protein [Pseudomonadota bacterium]
MDTSPNTDIGAVRGIDRNDPSQPLQSARYAPGRRVSHRARRLGKAIPAALGGIAPIIDLRTVTPVLFALGFATGAYAYFEWPSEPQGWAVGLVCLSAGIVFLGLYASRQLGLWTVGGVVLAMALGFAYAKGAAVRTDTVTIAAETRPLQLEGWVRQVEGGRNGPRLRIEVHAIQSMDAEAVPRWVRVTHPLSLSIGPGRFVRCRVVLRPPPAPAMPGDYDFQRQAFFEGLGAVGYVQGRCRGGAIGAPAGFWPGVTLWIDGQRRRLAEHVRVAAGERAGGFAAALVSGDRSFIDPADQDALRGSGLAHLLAISGLHLAIVCGLVYLMVRRGLALIEPLALRIPVQKPAAFAALVAGAAYLTLSGASVSTQRAFIMAAIFFGAILVDRPGFSLRAFAIAMVAVVAIDPVSVTSPGFQMSFAATGALISTYSALLRQRANRPGPYKYNRFNAAVSSLVITSVVATFATAPFALYHFDRVSGAGLIANLLAMPIVSIASAPSAGATLVLAPLGLGDIGLRALGYSLEAVLIVAHWASGLPGQSLSPVWPMPEIAFGGLIAAISAWVLLEGWGRWTFAVALTIAAGFNWTATKGPDVHWGANGDLYVSDAAGVSRIAIIDGDGLGPLRYSDLPETSACQKGTCTYPTHRGQVRVSWSREGPEVCLNRVPSPLPSSPQTSLPSAKDRCDATLVWDASARQGRTLHLGALGRSRTPCRRRPWRPCEASI